MKNKYDYYENICVSKSSDVKKRLKVFAAENKISMGKAIEMLLDQSKEKRVNFCIWYYAQEQPLDANKIADWFASN